MIKKMFFYCILFVTNQLQTITVISFGGECSTASNIQRHGFSQPFYPFDWIVSDADAVYNAINDDFAHFLEPGSLKLREDKCAIVDYYGFQFLHDFPAYGDAANGLVDEQGKPIRNMAMRPEWPSFITTIREKYKRRIRRLNELFLSTEKVYIIRQGITKRQTQKMVDLLSRKYPDLDFIFVAISPSEEAKQNWNIKRVKNFYINHNTVFSDPKQWKYFFNALGIPPLSTHSYKS